MRLLSSELTEKRNLYLRLQLGLDAPESGLAQAMLLQRNDPQAFPVASEAYSQQP